MSFTFDPTTDIGKVRVIIGDKLQAGALFTDEEIQAMLDMEDGEIKLAAATLLDQVASSQALLQKKIKLGDIQTDGPAVAASIREQAKALRASADSGIAFDVVF
jgi:hypothetical protein